MRNALANQHSQDNLEYIDDYEAEDAEIMHGPEGLPHRVAAIIGSPRRYLGEQEDQVEDEERYQSPHDLPSSMRTSRRLSPSFRCCHTK